MNKKRLFNYVLIGIVVMAQRATAQDIHFSQFQSAAMHLSPAATGMMEERGRLNLQYRNQWAPVLGNTNAFKTISASYEHRIDLESQDFFGTGVVLWQDQAGALKHSQARASVAYARKLMGNDKASHFIIGGGEFGYSNFNIDLSDRRWVSQYDGNGGFDPNIPPDQVALDRTNFYDVSMGLAWHSTFKYKHQIFVGVALQHLNKAGITFDNSIYQNLHQKYSVHAGGEWRMTRFLSLNPAAMWLNQGPHQQIISGSSLKFYYKEYENKSFHLGIWHRLANKFNENKLFTDAIVVVGRIEWSQFAIGMSYDINISSLRLTNPANNALEFLLSYRHGVAASSKKMVTPRYF